MEICVLGLLFWGFHLELLWAAGIFQHQQSAPPKARTPKAKEWAPSSSSPSSLASAFTWVPTPSWDKPDPEGSGAAVAFLYSGDVSRLLQANCTQRFEVRDVGKASNPPPALRFHLRSATETLTHATNFLNMVFQTNDIRESSVKEDVEWYHALVRSIMEGDPQVYRAVLTFDAHPVSSKPQMMLQATKENDEILLQDLSASAESLRNLTGENEWYNFFRIQRVPLLYKRILSNDLKTLDTPKWSRGDSYVMDTGHIKWSPPFLECEDGKFLPNWMVTLSSSFYGLKPDLTPEFKGVVRMDVKVQNVDINQCTSGQGWFANTHQCDLNSTQCIPQEKQGFVLGRYLCLCKPGYYGTSKAFSSSYSSGDSQSGESASQYGAVDSGNLGECRPCREGCTSCVDDTPCLIQEDWSLRAAVLTFQAFCMLAVFLSMLVSYHFRKSKRFRASGIILLETILFGSLLLYFPVFILYFKPSIFRCIVLRWVRMLGFAIVYGTITLKLYRVLKVFLSRTAQRIPYMTSGRVLKMLALILLLVLWFLAAWTAGMLENIEKNIPLVVRSQTTRGLQFYICDHDRWDYMMVVAEMLFLLWGSFLCYATRTVPSAFHEPRYMGIALHNELITSGAFHVVRFLMVPSLHPDWTLLLFFIHTHVTTTMTLALLFIPKFLHAGTPLREDIAAEVYEDELDMRRSGSYLNNSITSAWSEHSLDPDDIRDELKKLYTQLEVHKTKKMTANNPHLQKKRSSKRGLGRSLMRRITEIPESMSRQCSKEEKDGSVGGGSGSRSSSYKRKYLDSGSSSMKLKDDSSSKHKVASSLKKSHSTYDHMRDSRENNLPVRHDSCKEAPLLDSLMRKKLAKKASERSNSDSLDDSVPLVYKSASAHNLSADKKPLHPRPSPLQKSLSVITSAKEKALLLTNRAYLEECSRQAREKGRMRAAAAEDSTTESEVSGHAEVIDTASEVVARQLQMDDASEGTVSSLLEDGNSSQDAVCPWEAETAPSTPSESRSQKHVTYAPIRSASVNTSDLPGKRQRVSKQIPPEPPIRQQSLTHNLERRDFVAEDAQDRIKLPVQSPVKDSKDGLMLVNIHSWETGESQAKDEMEKTRQTEDAVPSSAGLNRLASIAAEVCPWEVMQVPIPSKKEPQGSDSESQKSSPERQAQSPQISTPKSSMKSLSLAIKAFNQLRIKTNIRARKEEEGSQGKSEKEMGRKNEKPKWAETATNDCQRVTSRSLGESKARVVSRQATICPWEEEDTLLSPQKNSSPSKALEVCPWEVSQEDPMQRKASSPEAPDSKSTGEISPIKLERTKNQWESVCPWETTDADQIRENKMSSVSLVVSKTDNKNAEVCPWEVAEVTTSPEKEMSRAVQGDETIKEGKGEPFDGYEKEASSREALPVEAQENQGGQHDSRNIKESSLGTEIKKRLDLPPVDQKKPESVENRKAQASPWEMKEAGISVKTQICPWEKEELPSKEMMCVEDNKGSSKKEKSITPKAVAILQKVGNQEDSLCPWEPADLPPKSDTNNSATWRKSDNGTSTKATICPWEASDTLSEKLGDDSKGAESKKLKSPVSEGTKDASFRKLVRESSYLDSVCPWENASAEDFSMKPADTIPDLSKVVLKPSSSRESRRVEVCPWETNTDEVCPLEAAASSLEKRAKQTDGEPSKGIILKAAHPLRTPEENVLRDSICPWESKGSEESLVKPSTKSLGLSKTSFKKPDSFHSKRAEIAPWETQEVDPDIKTTICPWENNKTPTPKRALKKGASKEEEKITREMALEKESDCKRESVCPWESTGSEDLLINPEYKSPELFKGSRENQKAAVCPWEAEVGTKTEICPWEGTPALSDRTSRHNAGGAPKRTEGIMSTPPEKVSSPQESICPWEAMGTNDLPSQPSAKSPGLSKVGSKKSHSAASLKAEVCPWESQEAEPSTKAAVCPWEVPESPVEREPSSKQGGALESKSIPPLKEIKTSTTLEKQSSFQESICPWESFGSCKLSLKPEMPKVPSKKSDSVESLKVEVCPGEEMEGPAEKSSLRKESRSSTPLSFSQSMEKLSSSREEICPWESMELEETLARSRGQSPALSKSGSRKSDSAESLRAEVCPWEFAEEELSSKVEMRPAAAALFEKGTLRQGPVEGSKGKKGEALRSAVSKKGGGEIAFKKIEKSKSHQESVSPWDSMDFDKPLAKSTRSLDLLQISSKKSNSAESLKAEVCPWEFQELHTSDKAEICPWEVAEEPPERSTLKKNKGRISKTEAATSPMGCLKSEEKVSSSRESICSWESTELSSGQSPALSKAGSKKSDSAESLRAEVCPWEFEEEESSRRVEMPPIKKTLAITNKGALRQVVSGGSKGKTLAKPGRKEAASKRIEKARSHQELAYSQKSAAELSVTPSSKSLDLSQVGSKKSDSVESLKAEVCPWEFQELEWTAQGEVCPWEMAEASLEKGTSSKDDSGVSKGHTKVALKGPGETLKALEKGSSFGGSICPWESTDAGDVSKISGLADASSKKSDSTASRKADICPWEADPPEAASEEICPWEAGTELPSKAEKQATHTSRTETPTSNVKKSQSKQDSLAGHKPLCRTLADSTLPKGLSRDSGLPSGITAKSSSRADKCPWETEDNPVCPGGAEDTSPTSAVPSKRKVGEKSEANDAKGPSKAKSDICPWDCD